MLVVGVCLGVVGCAGSGGGGGGPQGLHGSLSPRERELREELFAEVNRFRASVGQAGLRRHAGLDRLAQEHSEYLRRHRGTFSLEGKNISHYGFEGRVAAAKNSMGMENLSENVIAGNQSGGLGAGQMVAGWKNSPGHLGNLRGTWDFSGMGVAVDGDGHVFATQIFATGAVKSSRWSGPQTTF